MASCPLVQSQKLAKIFHVRRQAILKIWNQSVNVQQNGNHSLTAIHNCKAGNTNAFQYDLHALGAAFQDLSYGQCANMQDAAQNLGVSKSTIM